MANSLALSHVQLPSVATFSAPMLTALTSALGIDRSVLASDTQIQNAWQNLPADLLPEMIGFSAERPMEV